MELVIITTIGCILALAACVTLLGITIHDIRQVQLKSHMRQQPRIRFRKQPLVSVYVSDNPTIDCIESIWNSDYQKIEINPTRRHVPSKLILTLKPDSVIDKSAIKNTVRLFERNRSLVVVELSQILQTPKTFKQLLHSYRLIAAAPFVSSRAGFGVCLTHPLSPIIVRPGSQKNTRTGAYSVARWLTHTASIATQLYACFLALILFQPILLIGCLGCFWFWMTMAITHYPHLKLRQRIFYLLFIPTSLGYLVLLGICAAIRPLFYRVNNEATQSIWKTTRRRTIST